MIPSRAVYYIVKRGRRRPARHGWPAQPGRTGRRRPRRKVVKQFEQSPAKLNLIRLRKPKRKSAVIHAAERRRPAMLSRRSAATQRSIAGRATIVGSIYSRSNSQRVRSGQRLETHSTDCIKRLEYKKTKMRQMAAQKRGPIALRNWRDSLDRQNPKVKLDC